MFLSIIIPCYNEGSKLISNLPTIYNYMFDHTTNDITFEIIVVNDGSTNNTKQILFNQIKQVTDLQKNKQFLDFQIVSYSENQGKGYAVKQGILAAKGDYCLFMDADLATDLTAIQDVLTYANRGIDVIIGSRKLKESELPIKRTFIRELVSKSCKKITNTIVPLDNITDTQCGFKAIKTDFAQNILAKHQTINRFAFDVEYLYMAKLYNKTIQEIPVIWTDDKDSQVKLTKSAIDFMKSLLKIRKNKTYYLS